MAYVGYAYLPVLPFIQEPQTMKYDCPIRMDVGGKEASAARIILATNSEPCHMASTIHETKVAHHRTFGELVTGHRFGNFWVDHPNETEATMWVEYEETIQTWVNGGEIILKKVGRDYAFRLANEPGDWMEGLPDGMVWADAQSLFGDSL